MKKLLLISVLCGMFSAVGAQTNVSGTIAIDSTFSIDQSPYLVTSSITINSGVTLTVDSGVVIEFNDGTGIEVRGTLDAYKATFTSVNETASRGDWNGITVGSYYYPGVLYLDYCDVLFSKKTHLYKGEASIANSSLQNSSEYGLRGDGGTTLSLTSTTITNNSVPIYFYGLPAFSSDIANNFTGNDVDRFIINPSYLSIDYTLPTVNIPYYFNYDFKIQDSRTLTVAENNVVLFKNVEVKAGSTLDVGSNTVMKFYDRYDGLYVYGTLTAEADMDEYIYFTSFKDDNWGDDDNLDAGATDPASEDWRGVRIIGSSSDTSSLVRCKVRFAGYDNLGGITLTNSSPTIDSCDIASNYFGVYIEAASSPSISNTIIGSSDMTPLAMSFEADPIFSNNQLSFSDNEYDAIGLIGGTMSRSGHIVKRNFTGIDNITYLLLSRLLVPDTCTLTIDPGIVIKADGTYSNYSRNIVVEGTLIADGTENDKIVFTSAKDDNHGNPGDTNKDGTTETPVIGDIGAIVFAPGSSSSSSLSNTYIKYAKGHYYENYMNQYVREAAVITVNSSPSISNNEIKDVMQGIRCYEASSPMISNNQVVNVSSTPFAISPSASPTFSGNSFTNAGIIALGLLGGDMTQSGTIEKTDLGGYDNIAYSLLYHLTVKEGTYMTIKPGVVLKVSNSKIVVEGGLKIAGSPSEKVILTSIKDDNVGNPADANGDGNATSPAAGDWTMIRFEDSSNDDSCLIENAELRYAGRYISNGYYYYYYSTIETSNANPTIRNTSIGQGLRYGVRVEGNSAPLLDGVTIQNMEYEPIGMSLTSNPTLSNLSFIANRAKGLAIIDKELSSDATLISRDVAGISNIAYVINERLTIKPDARFTISPNVNIKMKDYNTYIVVEGAMIADGTPSEKIVFTSLKDDSYGGDTNNDGSDNPPVLGDWRGLYFTSSGLDSLNILDNVSVRYGGYDGESVSFNACEGLVSNSSIELSKHYGIEIIGSANPLISNNDFYNIQKAPIYMSMFAEPTFVNNSISNVGRQAIQIIPETYSKTDTLPFRSFAGVDSITYCMLGSYVINDGTTITIPAGMIFKTTEELYWYYYGYPRNGCSFVVNGQLQVEGTPENPAVFTSFYDDTQGRPLDTGSDGLAAHGTDNNAWFVFNNVSDDASVIDNALIKYGIRGVDVQSASPTITNNTFMNCERGVLMTGVSEPNISDNIFHDLELSPMAISLVAYPAADANNVISGSTYKVIEVNEETLTQDITLPKRSFGGIPNIPYYFHGDYTVGTGAVLSIDSGVVCKFNRNSVMTVQKGLMAKGGALKENNVVFTHIGDDFYGGDSNSDSTETLYGSGYNGWEGLSFSSTSINESCVLDHCTFRNIYYSSNYSAIKAVSSSPTITNSHFSNVMHGVSVEGSGNPIINNCDFYNVKNNAVNNIDQSFVIDATNNWWGSNTGPMHTDNPTGMGVKVSDGVNYSPWGTMGANNPILGDVSQNGEVQAYDAALILKSTVGTYTLSPDQIDVADVTGNQGVNAVSALDASMVLRYSVGLIHYFEATTLRATSVSNAYLSIDDVEAQPREMVELPIVMDNVSGTYALQIKARYNPALLENMTVEPTAASAAMNFTTNIEGGYIYISMAGTSVMVSDGPIALLKFSIADKDEDASSAIDIVKFIQNEDDLTLATRSAAVIVTIPTNLVQNYSIITGIEAYPNPFDDQLNIKFNVKNTSPVSVRVFSQYGQLISVLTEGQRSPGQYDLVWNGSDGQGNRVAKGLYFIKFVADDKEQVLKVQMF